MRDGHVTGVRRVLFRSTSDSHAPRESFQLVEMIRAARDYRWLAVYKIVKEEFVILAGTGDDPPTYPRFPITQGLCEIGRASCKEGGGIAVGDTSSDVRK